MTEAQIEELLWDWDVWARPNQLPPPGDWQTWVALAGRGYGKTEAGAQWVRKREQQGARKIALVAETSRDLNTVMVPRLLNIYPEKDRPTVRFNPVKITWPSGAIALGYNGTEPDQLRGPEFDTAWVDEFAKYARARDTWDMLQFTMRSGDDPRVFITTTPRPIAVLKEIIADPTTVTTTGSTRENKENLSPSFLKTVEGRYGGTRLGRQELNAEILDDLPGALWQRELIDKARLDKAPELCRVVVAVDPSGTKGGSDGGDEVGIVVAGLEAADHLEDQHYHVLADRTCKLGPSGWAKEAIKAYNEFGADRVVAEVNYGGAMVESTIRSVDPDVSYKAVHASRGKIVRAEPVAALYEQGRVHHIGPLFLELEDQMCNMAASGYAGDGSPDRADALVWAITELSKPVDSFEWHVGD